MTYKCEKCSESKILEEMAKDASKPNGIKKVCKRCENDRLRKSRRVSKLKAKEKSLADRLDILEEKIYNVLEVQGDMYKILKNLDTKTKP